MQYFFPGSTYIASSNKFLGEHYAGHGGLVVTRAGVGLYGRRCGSRWLLSFMVATWSLRKERYSRGFNNKAKVPKDLKTYIRWRVILWGPSYEAL